MIFHHILIVFFLLQISHEIQKVTEFLNHMHDVCKYQMATVNQRINAVERKLDYLEASLVHSDPAKREQDNDDFDFIRLSYI